MSATATKARLIQWMQEISDCGGYAVGREFIESPSTINRNGTAWSVACNGRMMIAIREDLGFKSISEESQKMACIPLLNCEAAEPVGVISIEALREWSNGLILHRTCQVCGGSRKIECPRCGCGTVECEECDENGREWTNRKIGMLGGKFVDKRYVWCAARVCPLERANLVTNGVYAAIVGDGFTAVICELNGPDYESDRDDVFEAFEKARA